VCTSATSTRIVLWAKTDTAIHPGTEEAVDRPVV
jgi:hypothetical protein